MALLFTLVFTKLHTSEGLVLPGHQFFNLKTILKSRTKGGARQSLKNQKLFINFPRNCPHEKRTVLISTAILYSLYYSTKWLLLYKRVNSNAENMFVFVSFIWPILLLKWLVNCLFFLNWHSQNLTKYKQGRPWYKESC